MAAAATHSLSYSPRAISSLNLSIHMSLETLESAERNMTVGKELNRESSGAVVVMEPSQAFSLTAASEICTWRAFE